MLRRLLPGLGGRGSLCAERAAQEWRSASPRCVATTTLCCSPARPLAPHAGIARAIGAAAGKEVKIVHYDPAQMGLKKGEGFPFR